MAGVLQVGEVLEAGNGTWSGVPSSFSYQWQRCDAFGANCAAIGSATAATYTLVQADLGGALKVEVTASNASGSVAATSVATTEVVNTYSGAVLADAPRGYWRLGETNGTTAADSSGNGLDASFVDGVGLDAPGGLPADANRAAGFDGINDTVRRAAVTTKTSGVTLEAWVYWTGGSTPFVVYNGHSGANGYGILISDGVCGAGDRITVLVGGVTCSGVGTGPRLPKYEWTHVVAALAPNSTFWTLYVNGSTVASASGKPNVPTFDTAIGGWGTLHQYEGRIDEVAIYETALSAARVAAHYAAGSPGQTGDAPRDGAIVDTATPVLRATPQAGTVSYQFQVAEDPSFATLLVDSGSLPNTNTFMVPAGKLTSNADYYWRWRIGTGAWTGHTLTVQVPMLGVRQGWPVWSRGPLAVNQANGNLIVSLPGPSYPTALGSLGASLAYNSLDPGNRGFGTGWALAAGEESADPPLKLTDRSLLTGPDRVDAVEAAYGDGSSLLYGRIGQTNAYQASPGDGSLLSRNADGSWTLTDGVSLFSFGVTDPTNGVASLTGVETLSADPGKGKLTHTFSPADPSKVTSIADGSGRTLTFTWNRLDPVGCSDAILCIRGPDNVTWRFKGDGAGGRSGRLASVHNGTRTLAALSYDGAGRVAAVRNANDLDPLAASPGYNGNHALAIGYDAAGRVGSVSDGPVTGQTPTTAVWSFTYQPGAVQTTPTRQDHDGLPAATARTAAGYTTLTPPRQQAEPSPKVVKTFYDQAGHAIEVVDQLGHVTMAAYNARDQLLWAEDEEGNPTDQTWDTVNDVLLTTTGPDADGAGPLPRPTVTNRYDETQIGTSAVAGTALSGLQASYYANANLAGRPAARRTDALIDFSFGTGAPTPLPGVTDSFSIRWSGNLLIGTAGAYTFSTLADDGVRLTVDGFQAINDWQSKSGATVASSQPLTLAAGLHKIVLEYFELSGNAEIELRWACAACSPAISQQVIPATALRPAWLNQTSTVSPLGRVGFQHYADPASGRADYSLAKLDDGTNVITSFTHDSYGRITRKVMPKGNASRTIDISGSLQGSPNLDYATDWAYYSATESEPPPTACGGGTTVNQAELPKSVAPHGIAATTTVYDSAGRPIASSNGKGTTCTSYDAEGRLTSAKAPGDTQAATHSYDPAGQTRTITNSLGTVSSDYDEAGRIKKSTDSFGAEASFAYDSEGNLVSRIAATGALASSTNYTTSYGYDEEGALTSLTDPAGRAYSFYYDARGRLKATQYPNGTFSWSDYNLAGSLTALYNRHGTLSTPLPSSVPADANPLADYTYTYELEGRKTQEARSGGGLTTETKSYVYDELGRLETVTLPTGVTRNYGYDLDSNRTQIIENATTVASYSYDPAVTAGVDQLTSVTEAGSTRTFTYTTDGEVTSYGDRTLNWDGWGRLTGGSVAGASITYEFDSSGFRRKRTGGTSVTQYLHGGLFETDDSAAITLTDIDGPGSDLAHYSGAPNASSAVNYRYYNGHGDLAASADASGTRSAAYSYDPFGSPLQALPSNALAERWTARWDKKHDAATGLIEMGVRPYDPMLGRFLAIDPIDGGSCNAYDYACQDPINLYDLDGRCIAAGTTGACLRAVAAAARSVGRSARGLAQRIRRAVGRAGLSRVEMQAYQAVVSDANKMHHIFGKPTHQLANLVRAHGSQQAVVRSVVKSLGQLQAGRFEVQRVIAGENVTIRGAVINGVPRIGTFFVP